MHGTLLLPDMPVKPSKHGPHVLAIEKQPCLFMEAQLGALEQLIWFNTPTVVDTAHVARLASMSLMLSNAEMEMV
jgi:hypothetical protein